MDIIFLEIAVYTMVVIGVILTKPELVIYQTDTVDKPTTDIVGQRVK